MLDIASGDSAFDTWRCRAARGLFGLATRILRLGIACYERSIVSSLVVRSALFAVRVLERSAMILLYGQRLHLKRKRPDQENLR
jgi:hypothetical protein